MQIFRNKTSAVDCFHLSKGTITECGTVGAHVGFVCDNSKVCGDKLRVTFSSLDFCCTCEHWRKSS